MAETTKWSEEEKALLLARGRIGHWTSKALHTLSQSGAPTVKSLSELVATYHRIDAAHERATRALFRIEEPNPMGSISCEEDVAMCFGYESTHRRILYAIIGRMRELEASTVPQDRGAQ